MGEIFYLAQALAITGIKYKRAQLIDAYATCILYTNESVTNYEDALKIAKSNLGYFTGCY